LPRFINSPYTPKPASTNLLPTNQHDLLNYPRSQRRHQIDRGLGAMLERARAHSWASLLAARALPRRSARRADVGAPAEPSYAIYISAIIEAHRIAMPSGANVTAVKTAACVQAVAALDHTHRWLPSSAELSFRATATQR